MKVLVVDLGGSHIKVMLPHKRVPVRVVSGPTLRPHQFVKAVKSLAGDVAFDVVSIGYPGLIVHGRIAADPHNLGPGWVRFDFTKAFGCPVRLVNDAAMQALGSYEGGRMLFLGLGTGLGSAMVVDGHLQPMELAHLPYKRGRTFEEYVGAVGFARCGKKKWRKHVADVIEMLRSALEPTDIVIGGGNVKKLAALPRGARIGENLHAFRGGLRLWTDAHAAEAAPAAKAGRRAKAAPAALPASAAKT